MSRTVPSPTDPPRRQAADDTTGQTTVRANAVERAPPPLRSPQEFYAEITKRPDVREILKRLANA